MKLFLIGMMGSGKSHWARKLSSIHNIDWLDLDIAIEQTANQSIQSIFETEGEASFRQRERDALLALTSIHKIIVATGGGAPCFHNNMQWMNENGITIWLDEPIDILVARAMKQVAHRPAIQNLTTQQVQELFTKRYEERKHFYQLATYHLQGHNINEASFGKIIQQYAF